MKFHRWAAGELKKVIDILSNPELGPLDVDPELHKRMDKTVQDGHFKCFNTGIWVGPADGDQNLNLWASGLEDVVWKIMEDPMFKGNQSYRFKMDLGEAGKRMFGSEANAVYIRQGTLHSVGCPHSWQSGLGRACRIN